MAAEAAGAAADSRSLSESAVFSHYHRARSLRLTAAACGALVLILGLSAVVARLTGFYILGSFIPGTKVMVPAAAVSFILLGLCHLLTAFGRQFPIRLMRGVGVAVSLLALLRLAEFLAGLETDLSSLFLSPYLPQHGDSYSVPGAIIMVLLGAGLLLFSWRATRIAALPVASASGAFGATFVLGYVYGKPLLYGSAVSPIALPAAVCLMLSGLGLAVLAQAWLRATQAALEAQRAEVAAALTRATEQAQQQAAEAQRLAAEMETQRNLLQDMVTYAPAAMLLLDGHDLRVKLHNQSYTHLQEPRWHDANLVGMRVQDYQPGVEESGVAEILRSVAAGQLRSFPEFEYQHFTRGTTYFNWVNIPIPRADAEGYDILVMVIEITDQVRARKRVEALTEEARRRVDELEAIIQSIADGVIVYDAQGQILRMNRRMRELLRYNEAEQQAPLPERVRRLNLRDETGGHIAVQDAPSVRALRGETFSSLLMTLYPGTEREAHCLFSGAPIRSAGGEVTGAVLTVSDVTQYRRVEQALRDEQERLKRAQEIAHLGSWELDLVRNELTWSDETYRIFGLQPKESAATYEAFLDRVHPDDRAAVNEAYFGSIRDGRDRFEIEHRVIRKDTGEIRTVQERCEHFRDASGKIARSIGMIHDITERKQAEEELRQHRDHLEELVAARTAELRANQERLRALASDLVNAEQGERQRVAGLLHDEVAQTLGVLKMQLAMLRARRPEAQEDLTTLVDMADEAVKQTRSIMTELSPPVLQQFGLVEAVRWWATVLQERYGLQVEVRSLDESPHLEEVLRTALFQAVKELLTNVVKHARARRAVVSIECTDDVVRTTVADDGVGFTPEEVETTARGGFGLFSIRERLTHLGGSMSITSRPGEGTTVTLTLPRACLGPLQETEAHGSEALAE